MTTPKRLTDRGFTLVEMLIALVLLSLLMLALTGAMRAMGQTSERLERRITEDDQYRTAVFFLRDVLSRASAREFQSATVAAAPGSTGSSIFFEAGPQSLAWIGVMPARYGVGGRHYLRLALEGNGADGAQQLVLRYAPWNGAPVFADWGSAQSQVLTSNASSFGLRYRRPDTGEWLLAWPPADLPYGIRLPSAIEVTIAQSGRVWPLLVAATQPLLISDPGVSRARFGGG